MLVKMLDLQEFLWGFSIISLVLCSLRGLRKAIGMALSLYYPPSGFPTRVSWVRKLLVISNGVPLVPENYSNSSAVFQNKVSDPGENIFPNKTVRSQSQGESLVHENSGEKLKEGSDSMGMIPKSLGAMNKLVRKRPGKLVVPEYYPELEFSKMRKKMENREFEVQGSGYCLASKKGRRETLEDAYGIMLNVFGDSKQAFFAVVDGHGGRGAADYVGQNLGKNIINALEILGEEEINPIELAIRRGHQLTDDGFLCQGVSGGACAASVLLKDGKLHVANVGDCRVVLSKNGIARSLTKQHRPCREDERLRIENAGGFVDCKNGVWRVQGSLAVSRAIGDLNLKQWVISEPEILNLPLTPDCQFLILASDGLWDKVKDQEAVDEVIRGNKIEALKACKRLLDMSFTRGNLDDVTVMVVDLRNFIIATATPTPTPTPTQ